ncbi:MAG: helix-turn-helix domain-containing protein [Vicinamibacterales bacterium]
MRLTVTPAGGVSGSAAAAPAIGRTPAPVPSSTIEPLDAVIKSHIERALEATAGRIDGPHGAARILKINPHTLRARMRKLRVDWRSFRVSPAPPRADG